ncbi:MAG TPA: transcription-repair coupling factor [Gammaproteobacteria bacterium]|nr:transcription-repair coupling factor [Gammaproteobacteria bacterium]|tara:strand:+ start:6222 stop:9689 length:3468 start_codon:yes stop_codon:yes gene_type:complete
MAVDLAASTYSPLEPPLPKCGEEIGWTHLFGAGKSLAIAEAVKRHEGLVVVVVGDTNTALKFTDEILFFDVGIQQYRMPDWEVLPYDQFSPYQDIISDRISTLSKLPSLTKGLVVVSIATLMHRVVPRTWLSGEIFCLKRGDSLVCSKLQTRLIHAGYRNVSQVLDHGDFAIRGSIVDVFPMGALNPFRIDLFDEEIETLRVFDAESQRSIEEVESLTLMPARETPLNDAAIARFKRNWRLSFAGLPTKSPIYNDISGGLAPAGIEYYLPLFFDHLDTLFDYIPSDSLIFVDEELEAGATRFREAVNDRYEQLRYDMERPILPPDRMFLNLEDVLESLKMYPRTHLSSLDLGENEKNFRFNTRAGAKLTIDGHAASPLRLVLSFLKNYDGRVLFLADSNGRRETMLELFNSNNIRPKFFGSWEDFLNGTDTVGLAVASLSEGVELVNPAICLVTEFQLFGERALQRRRRRTRLDKDSIIKSLAELQLGSPVVHEDHGIGRYRGLEVLTIGSTENEFIKLEYADGDKLYVPVASLNLINRYSGVDPAHAPIHKLGSGQWERAKKRATKCIYDVAAELLEVHARREARAGYRFTLDRDAYTAFCQDFPFEETPDQQDAIEAVLVDMENIRPMDRLVCGDVGFGKTEVAMRAAFVAANEGRQVAVLVPTTLLAQQHYQTFLDRFADWPIRVKPLSRFRAANETRTVLAGLRAGTVDIVIGTHKLLGADVVFKDLGLLIIDEEHRFGVRQKEKIKAIRSDVDILTLTATPIPRSLNLALSGTRELSIISTAPSKRLAIKTFLREWSDGLVQEALLREISRGGQVYFVHNEVESIEKIAKDIARLAPAARVSFAHGQMREKELERVMLDFYHRRCNILVCTTIIESGIDVPNANTIIINRADKFGLAQLYQLRGRIGRSHHRAYAYLIVPHRKSMTADAIKRLEAIESLEDLGVGFTLATHDMEIRGAGEILGEEQSGQMQEIGFGLYSDLLNRAVAALKSGERMAFDPSADRPIEIVLHVPTLFPEDYLPDVHTRLVLYKRIANAISEDELNLLKEEIVDRFGLYSTPVVNLFRVTSAKLRAQELGIKRIELGSTGGRIDFVSRPNIDSRAIIDLIKNDRNYRLDSESRLRVKKTLSDADSRFSELDELLKVLSISNAA